MAEGAEFGFLAIRRFFWIEIFLDAEGRESPRALSPLFYTLARSEAEREEVQEENPGACLVGIVTLYDPTQPDHLANYERHQLAARLEGRQWQQ